MITPELSQLMRDHSLKPSDLYLLNLMPLIEMIWIDGRNQPDEMRLLHTYAIEYLARLNRHSDGLEVISIDAVNDFLERFAHQKPSARLVRELRMLAIERLKQQSGPEAQDERDRVLFACLDIAAACTDSRLYPVLKEEKQLLKELVVALSA